MEVICHLSYSFQVSRYRIYAYASKYETCFCSSSRFQFKNAINKLLGLAGIEILFPFDQISMECIITVSSNLENI